MTIDNFKSLLLILTIVTIYFTNVSNENNFKDSKYSN